MPDSLSWDTVVELPSPRKRVRDQAADAHFCPSGWYRRQHTNVPPTCLHHRWVQMCFSTNIMQQNKADRATRAGRRVLRRQVIPRRPIRAIGHLQHVVQLAGAGVGWPGSHKRAAGGCCVILGQSCTLATVQPSTLSHTQHLDAQHNICLNQLSLQVSFLLSLLFCKIFKAHTLK